MLREVNVSEVKEALKRAVIQMNIEADEKLLKQMKLAAENEEGRAKRLLEILLENARIAKEEKIPLCQDTGFVTVFMEVGQDVRFIGGSITDAINEGVRDGYEEGLLRKSIVADPLFDRINTLTNTPAIVYTDLKEGNRLRLRITCKGQGSENCSKVVMLKPAQGVQGVKDAVLETVKAAGANACPPMVIGIGIGGSFDYCAVLAKKALLCEAENPDERFGKLEKELLDEINELDIGPQGLRGKTTALAVHILSAPCHIAGMPLAVNISCHVTRHCEVIL